SRPVRVATNQPLEPAVPRRQTAHRQVQPRQDRRRAQAPDRRLARPRPRGTLQTQPRRARHQSCPGKLPLSSGRLTARDRIEKPGQLQPTPCAAKRRKTTEQSSTPATKVRLTTEPSSKRRKSSMKC